MDDFYFKQFSLSHRKTAMKIGTDSVLLGAWVETAILRNALDVGTGTGVLALMLAQRNTSVMIDAIEPEKHAYSEARENFSRSPWADRLRVFPYTLYQWVDTHPGTYDLMISNPPYFEPSKIQPATGRTLARTTSGLSHVSLLRNASVLLSENGQAAFVLPAVVEEFFLDMAASFGLYPTRITRILNKKNAPPKRILLQLAKNNTGTSRNNLIIREENGAYSPAYRKLLQPFLLDL